jgi:hypothetical protein
MTTIAGYANAPLRHWTVYGLDDQILAQLSPVDRDHNPSLLGPVFTRDFRPLSYTHFGDVFREKAESASLCLMRSFDLMRGLSHHCPTRSCKSGKNSSYAMWARSILLSTSVSCI